MLENAKRGRQTTVELFCGIGGFRIACDDLGIETLWANDLDGLACEVYEGAFGSAEIIRGDIRQLGHSIPTHDLLTAGFPCQPFSSAGKKQGVRDPRGSLFEEIVTIVDRLQPESFVLENVKRLLTMESGDHFATVLLALSTLGYQLEWRLLNAVDFGLPQNRERVVIIGQRRDLSQGITATLASLEDLEMIRLHNIDALREHEKWPLLSQHRRKFPSWGLCIGERFYACDLQSFSQGIEPRFLLSLLEAELDEPFLHG